MRLASLIVAVVAMIAGSAGWAAGAGLEGKWRLASLPGVVSFEASKTELIFIAEDRAAMTVGCNRMSGTVRRDGDALIFGPIMATKMLCPPPLMDLEMRFQKAIAATRAFKIEGGAMHLLDATGGVTATFFKKP